MCYLDRFKFGIRDLDSQRFDPTAGTVKEGTLYRRDKIGGKRVWCVVTEGYLVEFPHDSVNPTHRVRLLTSSVRENRDVDRRFCFEVISPDSRMLYVFVFLGGLVFY